MKRILFFISLIFVLTLCGGCSSVENSSGAAAKNGSGTSAPAKSANQSTTAAPADSDNTSAVKKEACTIVIDPGHASKTDLSKEQNAPGSSVMKVKESGGAEGIFSHTPEYALNMKVALKLKSLLDGKGYRVVMTKTDNSLMLGNVERAKIGNRENAALVIRIHADSNEDQSMNGASILVPAKINWNTNSIADKSSRYGRIILATLTNNVGMTDRGVVVRKDLTGFNWSEVPVVLVEMGFLSNTREDKLLNTNEYQNKIASALAMGIETAIPLINK